MSGPLLWLDRASVRFGEVLALREVCLTIRSREGVTLVGANGSGKTTLLRLLHGLVAHEGLRRLAQPRARMTQPARQPFQPLAACRERARQ